jgi:hypothetical protein
MEGIPTLSGLGAVLALLVTTVILLLPRRGAMVPILAAVCFLPIGQALEMAGLHFYLFRLVLLAALARIVIRGEAASVRWCRLDTMVLFWMAAFLALTSLSHPGWSSFVTLMGSLFDSLGSYIVARSLVRDRRDLLLQLRFVAIMIIPLAAAMMVEKQSGRNLFSVLGGVSQFTEVRDGKVRAQGAFKHSILAGTFGATFLPLMVGLILMRDRKLRWRGIIGSVCAAFIVWAAASSGPMLAAWGSVAALGVWRLRHSLRLVRVGFLVLVLMLQAGMSRPVWWIFDSMEGVSGGSGWHRSYIIDAAIRHWDEWFLVGTPRTAHWGGYHPPKGDPNNVDITNEYIVQAVSGGALTLCLFVAVLWTCFKHLGSAFRAKRGSIQPETEWLAWCTGVALLAHCISFLSVAYWDQMIFYFFWLLSVIAAGTMERTWLIRDRPAHSVRPGRAPQSREARTPLEPQSI